MWGLFERRTNKMGLVRLLKLSPQNIWYIQICSETPIPLFELTQSWGLFEQWKFNFNMFSTLLWFEFKNNVGPYAKKNIYSWILLDKNISFPTSSYKKIKSIFQNFVRTSPGLPYISCMFVWHRSAPLSAFNYFRPEFTIVISLHYKPRIAAAVHDL